MKIKTTAITTGIVLILMVACKHEINQAVITGFITENKVFSEKLDSIRPINSKFNADKERPKNAFLKGITGKELASFQKDKEINTQLKTIEKRISEVIELQKGKIDSLASLISENETFIATISTSDKNEEQVKSEWSKISGDTDMFFQSFDELNKQITILESEQEKLLNAARQKYYPKEVKGKKKK